MGFNNDVYESAWFEEYKKPIYMEYFNIWLEEMGNRLRGEKSEGELFGLKEFANSFFEAYRAFITEYERTPRFDIGEKNIVIKCEENGDCKTLEIKCEMSQFEGYKKESGTLTIDKNGNILTANFKRDIKPELTSQTTNIEQNPSFILNYLDLFIKHSKLFNLIYWLCANKYTICWDEACSIAFSFDSNGSYVDGLKGMIIKVASFDYSENTPGFNVQIYIDLTTGSIVYDKCSIKLNELPFPVSDNKMYDTVLDYIRVSSNKLAKCEISGKKVGFEQIYEDFENYKNSLGKGAQKYLCDND